jgi:hypothetical protein
MAGTTEQAPTLSKKFWKSRLVKLFIAACAALTVYTLTGFYLAPYLIEPQLSTYVTESLGRSVEIEQIRFCLFWKPEYTDLLCIVRL